MVQNLSLPSYHEDQPSAMENTLAGIIGQHSPIGAAFMMNAEQTRRGMAQDEYHKYMAGVNALQQQNMAAQQAEMALKGYNETSNSLPHNAYAFEMAKHSPYFGHLFAGMDTEPATQAALRAQQAVITKDTGQGTAPMIMAGVGGLKPVIDSALGVNTTQGPSALVQAQTEANKGRIGAAALTANKANKGYTDDIKFDGLNSTKTHTPFPDTPHGLGAVIPHAKGGAAGSGAVDYSKVPNPLAGGLTQEQIESGAVPPGTGAPPTALSPAATDTPAPQKISRPTKADVDNYAKTLSPAALKRVQESMVRNNGEPIYGVKADHSGMGMVGSDGVVY